MDQVFTVASCAHVGNLVHAGISLGRVLACWVLPVVAALGTALVKAYHPL
jgi:hypothetical protein